MSTRLDYYKISPEAVKAFFHSGYGYLEKCATEPRLRYLVELRVSQINGCVYCVDLHSRQLRKDGESEQRIDCVAVWREAPFHDERERAALAWAEAVTRVETTGVPDSDYENALDQFEEKELVDLTFVIANMNLMNRIAISFRKMPDKRD
jgi:AhpD family alkylhydroperoxidase